MAVVATVAAAFYILEEKMANLNKDSIYPLWFGQTVAHKLSLDDAIDAIEAEERALDED